ISQGVAPAFKSMLAQAIPLGLSDQSLYAVTCPIGKMNEDYQFQNAIPARDALEKQRKAALKEAVGNYFQELIREIKKEDPTKLRALLDFFRGKVTGWSSRAAQASIRHKRLAPHLRRVPSIYSVCCLISAPGSAGW